MGTTERRERDRQRRRSDILGFARELFFERGYRDTTIDDIARAAELARGTIYLYFSGKEDIYAHVLEEGLDILQGLLKGGLRDDADPLTNLLAGHEGFMRFHDEYPHYYNVLIIDKLQITDVLPEPIKVRLDEKMAKMVEFIARCLDRGVVDGIFRPMDTTAVAILQMGMATGIAIFDIKPDEMRDAMQAIIAGSVLSRRSPESE
jgi:AcrR family transcriptional regulator